MIPFKNLLLGCTAALAAACAPAQQGREFRILEYNVENLFDCQDDTLKNDEEFLPNSPRMWTYGKFQDKLNKISKVILAASGEQVPDLVGLCEVENEHCVHNLVTNSPLKDAAYQYAMTDSPDQRGIDVVLLYQPATFRHLHTQTIRIESEKLNRRPTRDILHVSGRIITGDTLDVFVCHMPSRSGGAEQSEPYRLFTAGYLRRAADSIMAVRLHPQVVIMGDFNDFPTNRSLTEVVGAVKPGKSVKSKQLYNLMDGKEGGTYRYRGHWDILDQMIVNGALLDDQSRLQVRYEDAEILAFPFLMEEDNKYGGDTPSRTYWGRRYNGGYSDHLPVLMKMTLKE